MPCMYVKPFPISVIVSHTALSMTLIQLEFWPTVIDGKCSWASSPGMTISHRMFPHSRWQSDMRLIRLWENSWAAQFRFIAGVPVVFVCYSMSVKYLVYLGQCMPVYQEVFRVTGANNSLTLLFNTKLYSRGSPILTLSLFLKQWRDQSKDN